MNELGLSCTIFKYVMRISGAQINPIFLETVGHSFSVLSEGKIVEMGAMLGLLN